MSTKIPTQKTCSRCLKLKSSKDNFYLSSDDLIHKDGRIGVCKQCLIELMEDFNDVETVIEVLRRIDKPFIKDLYDKAIATDNAIGRYFKDIAMPQTKGLTYADSQFDEDLGKFAAKGAKDLNRKIEVEEVVKFKITPEMVVKWGSGYSEADLFQLEQFYIDMRDANNINSPQLTEQLKLLCKVNLEQNNALNNKDYTAFKTLNQQFQKILQDSGFRAIDKVSGGESAGIRTFGQIWEEIERDGFIEPYLYQEKQDIVDKTIMHMLNYTRRLLNVNTMTEPPDDTPNVDEGESYES